MKQQVVQQVFFGPVHPMLFDGCQPIVLGADPAEQVLKRRFSTTKPLLDLDGRLDVSKHADRWWRLFLGADVAEFLGIWMFEQYQQNKARKPKVAQSPQNKS